MGVELAILGQKQLKLSFLNKLINIVKMQCPIPIPLTLEAQHQQSIGKNFLARMRSISEYLDHMICLAGDTAQQDGEGGLCGLEEGRWS